MYATSGTLPMKFRRAPLAKSNLIWPERTSFGRHKNRWHWRCTFVNDFQKFRAIVSVSVNAPTCGSFLRSLAPLSISLAMCRLRDAQLCFRQLGQRRGKVEPVWTPCAGRKFSQRTLPLWAPHRTAATRLLLIAGVRPPPSYSPACAASSRCRCAPSRCDLRIAAPPTCAERHDRQPGLSC